LCGYTLQEKQHKRPPRLNRRQGDYEQGFNKGINMSADERNEWLRGGADKKQ
jgi:hypothetical protein